MEKIDLPQGLKMLVKTAAILTAHITLITLTLSGCFHPPFNNFHDDHRTLRQVAISTGIGAGAGAIAGSVAGSTAIGAAIGGAAGATIGFCKNSKRALINDMQKQDMQFIEYGDTATLLVPTDHYFLFNSPHLNDICYAGLNNIIRLLKYYPESPIYVAGFTDNVGNRHHKKMLSQAQAETMLTFLWANDIHAQRLHAEGYADEHTIGDNHLIHGSAYNRRIEIQWPIGQVSSQKTAPYVSAMK